MLQLVGLLVDGLATWRLSRMLVSEVGPNGLLEKLRLATGVEEDVHGNKMANNAWTPLFCVDCLSFWMGLIMLVSPLWARRFLALSAIAVILNKQIDQDSN